MKERLDVLLVEKGFFETIEKAKRAIMVGNVIVNEKKVDKCGTFIKIDEEPNIRIKGDLCPYVSRGGYKLEKAIGKFNMELKNKIVLDIGASTGGFSDCALQHGADFVYAIDVGTNQLDYKIRVNEKVKSIENTHIKDLTEEDLDGKKIDVIVMDVSFISITKILTSLIKFCHEDTLLMFLIKPQFEVSKENIGKGGIISDTSKHIEVFERVIKSAKENLLYLKKIDFSPIRGGKGNVEYISLFSLKKNDTELNRDIFEEIIKNGQTLGGKLK
ncbi:MAG: TlyA family RNA methyltransferase [Fusobacteriaceae bacterium]